ncbi:GGDEF domain-containing protein [Xanthomonas sp. SI]|uniref:GGDEF domain-containing protein n=1 Tax=Xanthomonas sp. SI TaxID=2724123 RepID=UPI00163AF48D|nr:GGDEF domain-containing protein [Xanthomonas sp. SI]QNH14267.1 GGDEF domain-containing protein [Xanthomonas sp. SI]
MEWIAHLAHAGTLLIVNALLAAVSAAMFLALHLTAGKARNTRGLLLLSLSYGTFAAGFGTLLLPRASPGHPDAMGLIGNLTIDIATVLTLFAVNAYLRRPLLQLWILIPVAAIGAAEIYCLRGDGDNLRVMVICGCTLRGLLTVATGAALWRHADERIRTAARFTALFHFLWALMLLLRIAWWSTHPSADASYDPTSTFGLLSRMVLTAVITPGFLWMLTREMHAELERHASQDSLTGVANRRVMWEKGESATQEARGRNSPIAVLMIDVDNFKSINDRLGHATGDQVLIAIADTLARHIRSPDFLARVGGEEFMVLIPQGDESVVRDIAERLRRVVERQEIAPAASAALVCTVSIGYCISAQAQIEWQKLVVIADQALYAAKRGGRNRVTGTVVA